MSIEHPNDGVVVGLVEPFDTDDESLDGVPPEQAFTLGVEWQIVRASVEAGSFTEATVHLSNARRLQSLLARHGLPSHLHIVDDTWASLSIEDHQP